MKEYYIYLIVSFLLLLSCNSNNIKTDPENCKENSITENSERYYFESDSIYTFVFDSIRPLKNTLIYDTLCFFEYYNDTLITDALLTVDSAFSKIDGISMIDNFKKYKNESIYNFIINSKYRNLITKIDSADNYGRFFISNISDFKPIQLLISAPLFNSDYTKCLIYVVSYIIEKNRPYIDIKVDGRFVYLIKQDGQWKFIQYVYYESPFLSNAHNKMIKYAK